MVTAQERYDGGAARFHIFSATFRTVDGATAALCHLGDVTNQGLVDLENATALTRATSGRIAFLRSDALSAWPGCGRGAFIMGILGLCFLAGTVESADRAAFVTRLHDVGFEDDDLHALAEELVWGTSLLMAVIARQQVEPVDDILNEVAVKIGWAVMSPMVAEIVQQFGALHPWSV
jgi:uncharacterized membrane protein